METRTYYRVVTPVQFSDIDRQTLKDALKELENFGNVPETSEYFQYWQELRGQCCVARVTETIDRLY